MLKAFLTITDVEVGETKFRALVSDEDFSVEREDHGFVLHVDHTTHNVTRVPTATEEPTARVESMTLLA